MKITGEVNSMSSGIVFDEKEVQTIISQYKNSRMTIDEIAKRHYCSEKIITKLLRNYGVPRRPSIMRKYNREMIIHDYEAGIPVKEIAEKYGMKNKGQIYVIISKMRRKGRKIARG